MTQMAQTETSTPTNVQSTNPYVGLDRGLFIYRGDGAVKYARMHAGRWVTNGPEAAVGVLEFQVMVYNSKPELPADYAAGTLAKAPDGTEWFNTFTRGLVMDPIIAEYWASQAYFAHYVKPDAAKLDGEAKANALAQSKLFVSTMAGWAGLDALELVATYNALDGNPLTKSSVNLGIDYTRDGVQHHLDVLDLPTGRFDPVHVALGQLKNL